MTMARAWGCEKNGRRTRDASEDRYSRARRRVNGAESARREGCTGLTQMCTANVHVRGAGCSKYRLIQWAKYMRRCIEYRYRVILIMAFAQDTTNVRDPFDASMLVSVLVAQKRLQ